MKSLFYFLTFILAALILTGCGVSQAGGSRAAKTQSAASLRQTVSPADAGEIIHLPSLLRTLDELAELERAGSWFQGLAMTESGIRENIGDYAGAVAAAFKELSWAYGMGLIQKESLEQGILNVLAVKGEETVTAAANVILTFISEQWNDAAMGLRLLFDESEEPDGFGRWMILVCELSARDHSTAERRRAEAAYKSIRARYVHFPEYWYRGAKAFSQGGFASSIAAEFAENCINSSPQGPFADECRSLLASYAGLKNEDGFSIKTKKEIEAIISQSISSGNPSILESLLPLIALPDNPYTVYAVGALRALTSVPGFRDYLTGQASSAKGRLAERLSYICRS